MIFFRYEKKSTFSSPMRATPAEEPITSILPPVPAALELAAREAREAAFEHLLLRSNRERLETEQKEKQE